MLKCVNVYDGIIDIWEGHFISDADSVISYTHKEVKMLIGIEERKSFKRKKDVEKVGNVGVYKTVWQDIEALLQPNTCYSCKLGLDFLEVESIGRDFVM